ncbi:hypothetical protein COT40_00310 [Candidatus Peregrinibacteria bacterium CG08_land_8_20_14_0_20_41_10]|nr:MAG: hypothetical protein COT40_00310 [Candidatus Peregrinibacteria bacterium CG08_land_8_20_14_0_20_41_10]
MPQLKSTFPFAHLFWFLDSTKLDLIKDRNLIIHQTLAYGTMDDFKKLLQTYSKKTLCCEFQKGGRGLYLPAVLEFCRYLLKVKRLNHKTKYLKYDHLSPA